MILILIYLDGVINQLVAGGHHPVYWHFVERNDDQQLDLASPQILFRSELPNNTNVEQNEWVPWVPFVHQRRQWEIHGTFPKKIEILYGKILYTWCMFCCHVEKT